MMMIRRQQQQLMSRHGSLRPGLLPCRLHLRVQQVVLLVMVILLTVALPSLYRSSSSSSFSLLTMPMTTTTQLQHLGYNDLCQQDVESSSSPRYKGILLIQQGDVEGAAGTIFYLFVLNQLLYAERHDLYPWIHLNKVSKFVYDEVVHGGTTITSLKNRTTVLRVPPWDPTLPAGLAADGCPPPPPALDQPRHWHLERLQLSGNGIWASYFAPRGPPPTCLLRRLPVVQLTADQILHGLHLRCKWTVRAWRYGGTTVAVKQPQLDYVAWLATQRQRAAAVVQKYFQWQPALSAAIQGVLPPLHNHLCLGVHVRHSDKANQRRRIAVQDFLPYLQAYFQVMPADAACVYLATDSHAVVQEMRAALPAHSTQKIYTQPAVLRSSNTSAVFALTQQHHTTNWQVLVDIGALATCCRWLLHGLSAVSEAALYHGKGALRSINLEIEGGAPTPEMLQQEIRHVLAANGGGGVS